MPNNPKQIIRNNVPDMVLKELPGDLLWENSFQPDTNNPLTNNKFRFVLSRCPTMSYFCQRVNVPSLGFGTSIQSNVTGIPIRRPGTSYVYEDLQVGFMVNENLKSWLEIHNWIKEIGYSYDVNNEQLLDHQKIATAYILILNSSYRPQLSIKFKNLYPTFVSSIDFDSSNTDTETIIASATFAYTHYEIETFTTNP